MLCFKKLLVKALAATSEAAHLLEKQSRLSRTVHHKGRIDLVTETDLAIEALLTQRLGEIDLEGYEPCAVLAEESARSLTIPDPCWIIDPVDGTTNYAHGLPLAAISVAYYQEGAIRLGIVEAPLLGECYWAAQGQGAFCNGQPLSVSGTSSMTEALVATGFPYDVEKQLKPIGARLLKVLEVAQGVRRCGAASLDLVWVARGRFDAYYEASVKPWDVAAGFCIVTEAGGALTHMDGSEFSLVRGDVLASNGLLQQEMVRLLREAVEE
jgi:Archaeal fructose-1,6-bisphosphatase and related enzymes of inositol monophosphatase family